MKKGLLPDYAACIVFRICAVIFPFIPKGFAYFLGRIIGLTLYCLDRRHRLIAGANLRKAFAGQLTKRQIEGVTKDFYRSFGQSIIEIFYLPYVNTDYIAKYVTIEGRENIDEAFKKGKGVILSPVHEGNWEMANVLSANQDFPFAVFVKGDQKLPKLNELLNSYRAQKGAKVIRRETDIRQAIAALKANHAMAMTSDQGGRDGCRVDFFGRSASMSPGAVKLALKYGALIVPAFFVRLKGPYIRIILDKPFEVSVTGDEEKDTRDNLQRLIKIFEGYIRLYPNEYYWPYRIWKYGMDKKILILSDGKTGHLRQSQAVANLLSGVLKERGVAVKIDVVHDTGVLDNAAPDIVISCGSSIARLNLKLAKENQAKSIVIMRPSCVNIRKFDLAIVPKHDGAAVRKNIIETDAALNLIDDNYLKEQAARLAAKSNLNQRQEYIGLFFGGDSKGFKLVAEEVKKITAQLKSICLETGARLLVTTSRRTPAEVEAVIKEELSGFSNCALLIIANERNIPEAVGGILALSRLTVVSPESISMVSEAASSGKYTVVFDSAQLKARHRRFLNNLKEKNHIFLVNPQDLRIKINYILRSNPQISVINDSERVREALRKIL